jgi:hypothetical protein
MKTAYGLLDVPFVRNLNGMCMLRFVYLGVAMFAFSIEPVSKPS